MANKSRKNKQRGGWNLMVKNPNDRRAYKALILNEFKIKYEQLIQEGYKSEEAFEALENYISHLEIEAKSKDMDKSKQWFFFTPDEVSKTKSEITDCANTDRKDFKDYVSDLKTVYKFRQEKWSPEVRDKIEKLLQDLCPKISLDANDLPFTDAQEELPGSQEYLPVVNNQYKTQNEPIAPVIAKVGRRHVSYYQPYDPFKSTYKTAGSKQKSRRRNRRVSQRKRR